jgi:hypothetical protein
MRRRILNENRPMGFQSLDDVKAYVELNGEPALRKAVPMGIFGDDKRTLALIDLYFKQADEARQGKRETKREKENCVSAKSPRRKQQPGPATRSADAAQRSVRWAFWAFVAAVVSAVAALAPYFRNH